MPSFGIPIAFDPISYSSSQGGTYKLRWDIPIPKRSSLKASAHAQISEFYYCLDITGEEWPPKTCPLHEPNSQWMSFIRSGQIVAARADGILRAKVEAWEHCLSQLSKFEIAIQKSANDLGLSFRSLDEEVRRKIASLKAARKNFESLEIEKPNEKVSLPSNQKAILENGSNQDIQISVQTLSSKKPIALERFEEIALLAKSIIDPAYSVERCLDKQIQDAKLKLRIIVNKKVVQIANSRQQISNIVHDFLVLFNNTKARFGTDMLSYCFHVLGKKLIEQAETQVSLYTPSAFPIAQVVVDLSIQQKDFLFVLLYLIMSRCPYAIPKYIPRQLGQTEQSHRVAQGYNVYDDQIEGENSYNERMSGILSLLGAIMQAKPTIGALNPYGIQNGWIWLASILNMKPQPITPYMICSFLECAGYDLWRTYQSNFLKLLKFMKTEYLGMIPPDSIGARTRLEIYINDAFSHDSPSVNPPEALLMMRIDSNTDLSEETMVFDLFPLEGCNGSPTSFSPRLTQSDAQTLRQASSTEEALVVKSVKVRKAEGGAVIGLHHKDNDQDPAISISFVIDIHNEVCLPHLKENYFMDNARVFVSDKARDSSNSFEKISISKPFPQFLVLNQE